MGDSKERPEVFFYAPKVDPAVVPAPRRIPSSKSIKGQEAPTAGDDYSSVKIQEASSWRSIFADVPDNDGTASCYSRFKFTIWTLVALALFAGVIVLAVVMVVVHDNRYTGSEQPYVPPGTLKPDTNDGSGGGGGAGDGGDPIPERPDTAADGKMKVMANPPFTVESGWTALWWDEFDGTSLNMDNWNYDTGYGKDYGLWAWGNREEQYYKPENARVANGVLEVTAKREETKMPDGYVFKYSSARLNTRGKVGFYGGMTTSDGRKWGTVKIEAAIKAPAPSPTGLWVAFWMLPTDMRYGVWASSGEIDVYEMKNDFTKTNMALHYGGPYPKLNKRYNLYNARPDGKAFSEVFTPMTMEWTSSQITMSMSGEEFFTLQSRATNPSDPKAYYSDAYGAGPGAPFDIPFYLIFNLAVGGKYPGNATEATVLPATVSMDYVRIFGKP